MPTYTFTAVIVRPESELVDESDPRSTLTLSGDDYPAVLNQADAWIRGLQQANPSRDVLRYGFRREG